MPPSDTPGFDKTFAPQLPAPPVAQPPRNPSLADILAPWIRPPDAEPPPPALPPSETPGLDKAIARINAPTPGFDLTPGLGGFSQPPMWSLPPPPKLLPMPPLPVPPRGGGLGALGSTLPPTAPAPSPLILAGNVSAPTMEPPPGIGPGIPETLMQIGRRLMPYATEMGAAIGHTLPSVGAAGAGALAAAPILLAPNNTGPTTIDLGDGLRTSMPPGQRYVPIERRVAPGVFGTDVGATWKQVPGLYGEVDPGRGVLVDPDRLREALGDEAADRVLNTPGIMPMAKRPSDKQRPIGPGHNQPPSDDSTGGSPPDGGGPPSGLDAATAITLGAATAVIETAADPVGIANKLLNFERGRQFEKDVLKELGLPETKKKKISVIMNDGTLVTVIPDAQSTTLITEVKDVVNLYNSKQFRAYLATNRRIDLIVSPNTRTISKPLQELIRRSEGSIRIFDPATKTFTPWVPK